MEQHLPEFVLALVVALFGGANVWLNLNIQLAISNLRNEFIARISESEKKIAILERDGDRVPQHGWRQ